VSAAEPIDLGAPGTTVMLAEDHQMIAQGLEFALRREGFGVVATNGPTVAAIIDLAREVRPTLAVLDLDLGDVGSGVDLIAPLRELGTEVLMLTGETDRVQLARCVEAGAIGLASKAEPFGDLLEKLLRVLRGESALPLPERAALLEGLREHRLAEADRMAPFADLTPREQSVLAALMDGDAAEQIASKSYVSVATVRSQIQSVLRKLGVNSQLAAVAMARQAGWRPNT
jgi:two-component system, NarL family, nitrate/nitrite response regulator NarL